MIDLLTTLPTDRKRTHTGFVPSCPPAFFRISVDFALPQQEYVDKLEFMLTENVLRILHSYIRFPCIHMTYITIINPITLGK